MSKQPKRRRRRTLELQIADLEAEIEKIRAKARQKQKFSPEGLHAERERLGLSQAAYAKLVGVSTITVGGWENDRFTPQAKQIAALLAVKGIAKSKAWKQLGLEEEPPYSGDDIRAERERLDLSQAAYAELVGVSTITIGSWENGRTSPRAKQVEALLAVKGIAKAKAWNQLGLEESGPYSGEDIRAERERLELSATAYAELLGVSLFTVYAWEQGRSRPRQEQVDKLNAVWGIKKADAWDRLGIESEFSPESVAAERERLELSAADYAELVGVSPLTVYNWEKGKTAPQASQLEKWLAVNGIGKRKAWRTLGY